MEPAAVLKLEFTNWNFSRKFLRGDRDKRETGGFSSHFFGYKSRIVVGTVSCTVEQLEKLNSKSNE